MEKLSQPGMLSIFPKKKDTKFNLHQVTNNAEDSLRQSLTVNGKYIILNDTSKFPDSGIIKITSSNNLLSSFETIFYGNKINNQLFMLHRGYNGTSPRTWPVGSKVACPLMAEHHNALKDAIINIQKKVGLQDNPTTDSINGVLTYLENKWLAPKPVFKAYPRTGAAPLTVNFHNFSNGYSGRYLWDFGDGNTATENHPSHTYQTEGKYNVSLTMISADGGQGLTQKKDYIVLNNEQLPSFFYATPLQGSKDTIFKFIDQSDGDIRERHWFFGDGKDITISNPHIHTIEHNYDNAGDYLPSLIIRLANNKTRRMFLKEGISVI